LLGQTVSHYRIVRQLGAGGMGVVYEAEDTRLRRNVAVKFLSAQLAQDAPMLERFEREARAASALNHPGICTVHAIEQEEGQSFIVMELVDGDSLSTRMAGGPMEIRELLDLYEPARGEREQLVKFLQVLAARRAMLNQQSEDIAAVLAEIDTLERQCRKRLRPGANGSD